MYVCVSMCVCVHGVLRNFYVIDNFLVFLKAVRIEVLLCKDGNKKHWCKKVQYVLFMAKCGITTIHQIQTHTSHSIHPNLRVAFFILSFISIFFRWTDLNSNSFRFFR